MTIKRTLGYCSSKVRSACRMASGVNVNGNGDDVDVTGGPGFRLRATECCTCETNACAMV